MRLLAWRPALELHFCQCRAIAAEQGGPVGRNLFEIGQAQPPQQRTYFAKFCRLSPPWLRNAASPKPKLLMVRSLAIRSGSAL